MDIVASETPIAWRIEPVAYRRINTTTAGLDRIIATVAGLDGAHARHVSVFRKRLCRTTAPIRSVPDAFAGSDDQEHWNYWLRESDAYGSDLFISMAPELRAPTCFAREIEANAATLWLEDVHGLPAAHWSVERFARAMRHVGRFQGRFVSGERLPSHPWLCRDFLRTWIPSAQESADARYRYLIEKRAELLDAIEATPRTICHLDLRSANLLAAADDDSTVLLDWSTVGFGALAEDIANAVFDSFWMFGIAADLLAPLIAAAIDGYIAGLTDAGWSGHERDIRWNYAATAGLRFGLLAERVRGYARDEHLCRTLEERYDLPAATIIARREAVCEAALELARDVRVAS